MPRTSAAAVAGIIEWDSSISLDPFILMANELVTEVCGGAGYTSERLELIERLLAAHFYTLRDPRTVQETAGSVSETKQSAVSFFFKSSHYGQSAMLMDTAGGLALLNTQRPRQVISASWLGNEEDRGEVEA